MRVSNRRIIVRSGLISLLDGMLIERIINVCAPAGHGKTVAVQQWLNATSREKAIISLDVYDNDPNHFCRRFCAALRDCQPKNIALAKVISSPALNTAPDDLTLRAVAQLARDERAVLVIDDLHVIHNDGTLRLLFRLIKSLPENFQTVLISRNDSPPGISELLVKCRSARVTAEQLRFDCDEIMRVYRKYGVFITREKAESVWRYTGGWAIGINALLLSGGEASEESLGYFKDFIRLNVWEGWDEATREFMLNTASAHELCPPLCAQLTGAPDSEAMLAELMRNGSFIFQVGEGVYQYHHLFREFLRSVLTERGEEYLSSLLEKEGNWHLSQRDVYGAADCFLRSGSLDGVARCFPLLESDSRGRLIIEKLPRIIQMPVFRAAADKYPHLFYIMAWGGLADGRAGDVADCADRFYSEYPEILEKDSRHAHYVILMYMIDFRLSLCDIINKAAARKAIPAPDGRTGPLALNMPLLHRGTRDFSELAPGDTAANLVMLKGSIGNIFAPELELLAESLLAGLLYERGSLEEAYAHALAANAEINDNISPESKFCAMSALACILDALSMTCEAKRVLARIDSMIERHGAHYLSRNFKALEARHKLAGGDAQAAREWLESQGASPYGDVSLRGIYITFTTCRAYIATGGYASAAILLIKALKLAEVCKRPMDIIEAQMLLSIAYRKWGHSFQKKALRHLDAAVSLAHCFGYTQIFVSGDAELSDMLRRLGELAEQRDGAAATSPACFVRLLYTRVSEHRGVEPASGQDEPPIRYTDKQRAVMRLICEGKSYKEITGILGIKLPTLRSHIALIYKKLEVTSEIDAIQKIKASGLLDSV